MLSVAWHLLCGFCKDGEEGWGVISSLSQWQIFLVQILAVCVLGCVPT